MLRVCACACVCACVRAADGAHLVDDEREAAIERELPQPVREVPRNLAVAALAHDRLQHDRRDLRPCARTAAVAGQRDESSVGDPSKIPTHCKFCRSQM